jgi:hypothetical protein
MKLKSIPKASTVPFVGHLECTFLSLKKKQRKYFNNFVRRNSDVMKTMTVLRVFNSGLGVVRLLHLVNHLGQDRLLEVRPCDASGIYAYPREYFRLARQRKIGRKQSKSLSKQPGV